MAMHLSNSFLDQPWNNSKGLSTFAPASRPMNFKLLAADSKAAPFGLPPRPSTKKSGASAFSLQLASGPAKPSASAAATDSEPEEPVKLPTRLVSSPGSFGFLAAERRREREARSSSSRQPAAGLSIQPSASARPPDNKPSSAFSSAISAGSSSGSSQNMTVPSASPFSMAVAKKHPVSARQAPSGMGTVLGKTGLGRPMPSLPYPMHARPMTIPSSMPLPTTFAFDDELSDEQEVSSRARRPLRKTQSNAVYTPSSSSRHPTSSFPAPLRWTETIDSESELFDENPPGSFVSSCIDDDYFQGSFLDD
jgi:hypothetical protein